MVSGKFLDYAIELKKEQPGVFMDLMEDYAQGETLLHSSDTHPQGKVA